MIRRTPSGRVRPGGAVFDPGTLPTDLKVISGEASDSVELTSGDGDKTPLVQGSADNTPTTPRRTRTATTSEIELSPSHRNKFAIRPGICIDHDDGDVCPQYFRPKAARRTTISLSRKEVTNLGLTVAKRVEESIPEVASRFESNESGLQNPPAVLTEDDIRRRLHDTLTEEFDRMNEDTKTGKYFDRIRSASMSDLLENDFDTQSPPRRHDSFQGLVANHSSSSGNLDESIGTHDSADDIISISSARIEQSYVPAYHPVTDASSESEWVYVRSGSSTMDPRFARQSSIQSEPVTPLKRDKKLKQKSKSMDKVKRTLTGSGKFTGKLLKTAQALRRASVVSKPKKVERVRVQSVDMLVETGSDEKQGSPVLTVRPKSSRSEPPSPIPPKQSHGSTMPSSSKKHKSLKRFISKKSKSFNSKSKGKSEFLQDYETEMERECRLSFTESIENYSKNAVKPRAQEGELIIMSIEYVYIHKLA